MRLFMEVPVTRLVALSDFVGGRYRCFLFYVIFAALGGPLIRVSGVSMDTSVYGGSNDAISGLVRLRPL